MSYVEDICLSLIGFALKFLSLFFYGFLVFISCFLKYFKFQLMFSSRISQVSFFFFTFKCLIYLEFVRHMRQRYSFPFHLYSINVLQHHLLKIISPLIWNVDLIMFISYIHLDLFLVSIFCSFYQSVYSSTRGTLFYIIS